MPRRLQDWRHGAQRLIKKTGFTLAAVVMSALLFSGAGFAQDATKTVPQAYQLRFENAWVRVTRVHYGPRETIPEHAHPQWPATYVYLNDSGPVIFRHKGWEHPELTRPPTKAGEFRLSPTSAVGEVHEVENPSDTPSDFLRVEFKTLPVGRNSLSGRFYREAYPAGENFRQVQFENPQIRVTRLICAPNKSLAVTASATEPALFVILSVARFRSIESKIAAKETTTLELGQTIWVTSDRRFENFGDTPLELLRFDFRTAPVKPKVGLPTAVEKKRNE